MKRILGALIILMTLTMVSCEANVFIKAEPTPEGKATVDSVYRSIVGVEEISAIKPRPFNEFITDSIIGKRPGEMTPDETAVRDRNETAIKEILAAVFGKEESEKPLPGLTLTLLQGFDVGDFDKLAGLYTEADIAYMNEKLGSLCKPGETYTTVINEYYDFITGFMNGNVEGIINFNDKEAAELKIADVVTIRLATRFLFNTMVKAIYDDFAEDGREIADYIKGLGTEKIVEILTRENVLGDITNTYSILNKLKQSTTIVKIGFLEKSV